MITENDNDLNNREDYLDTTHDQTQDLGNADAAKFNTGEQEEFVNDREEEGNSNEVNRLTENAMHSPLTTQGNKQELEENLGGTTNLSLDQLKKKNDPEGSEE